ncbi:MAG: DUF3575 domain-containing protein [Bacteroidia bacterium]|nr:DUF3575 domain-containing protein [Bacteroidia bacterium]
MKTVFFRKSILAAFLLTLIFMSSEAFSQTTNKDSVKWGPRNVVKINPLSEIWGNAGLQYERALGPKTSLNTTVSLLGFNHETAAAQTLGMGVGAGTELRFYFPMEDYGQAPQGFYFGPTARVYQVYGTTTGLDENGADISGTYRAGSYSAGAVLGHQFIILDAFAIDTWIGANILTLVDQQGELPADVTQSLPLARKGASLKYGIAIGYAF